MQPVSKFGLVLLTGCIDICGIIRRIIGHNLLLNMCTIKLNPVPYQKNFLQNLLTNRFTYVRLYV